MMPGSTSVTRPRVAERAVLGRDGDRLRHALALEGAEEPLLGGRAEDEVDAAAAGAQLLAEREQRRRAVAAADEHAAEPVPSAA